MVRKCSAIWSYSVKFSRVQIFKKWLESPQKTFSQLHFRVAGNFRVVQIFAFFEGRAVNAKIRTGRNAHAPVFHMQSLWWVALKREYYNRKNFLPRKFAPSKISRYTVVTGEL